MNKCAPKKATAFACVNEDNQPLNILDDSLLDIGYCILHIYIFSINKDMEAMKIISNTNDSSM